MSAPGLARRRESVGRSGIDRRLRDHLGGAPGTFVEAGANDGLAESNTLLLERELGWTGLLIEPVPALAEACRRSRPGATVTQAALVSPTYEHDTITMQSGGLHSLVRGARNTEEEERVWASTGSRVHGGEEPRSIRPPARTLSAVIDEAGLGAIDLLCLDVEGYEAQVLSGLDLSRHCPRFILVEVWASTAAEITQRLGTRFDQIAVLGYLEEEWATQVALPTGALWEALYRAKA